MVLGFGHTCRQPREPNPWSRLRNRHAERKEITSIGSDPHTETVTVGSEEVCTHENTTRSIWWHCGGPLKLACSTFNVHRLVLRATTGVMASSINRSYSHMYASRVQDYWTNASLPATNGQVEGSNLMQYVHASGTLRAPPHSRQRIKAGVVHGLREERRTLCWSWWHRGSYSNFHGDKWQGRSSIRSGWSLLSCHICACQIACGDDGFNIPNAATEEGLSLPPPEPRPLETHFQSEHCILYSAPTKGSGWQPFVDYGRTTFLRLKRGK